MELSGVLATFSAWRSRVQIPPRILDGVVRKWQSGQVESLVMVCGFDSHPCHCYHFHRANDLHSQNICDRGRKCVGWASACPSGRNPPAFGHWRFNSVPTHLISNGPFF